MDDTEIIKALECCANNPNDSVCYESKCPLFGQKCTDILSKNALALINRQKAEIEELERVANKYKRYYFNHEYDELEKRAIKEFVERLKEQIYIEKDKGLYFEKIDNLVKEIVGEGE